MESPALEQYLKKVERYLPPWQAEEILKEIRSHAMDQAEEMAAARSVAVDEAVLQEAIRKLGAPEKLAQGYLRPVTLIRPEYTTPFVIYAGIAAALGVIFSFFGGPIAWLLSAVLLVGFVFVFFVILSRSPKLYNLPLWHPGLRKLPTAVVAGGKKLVEIVQGEKEMAGSAPKSETGDNIGIMQTPARPSAEPAESIEALRRLKAGFWERRIEKSGPRPLGPMENVGAAMRVVFGLAIAALLLFAPTPLRLLSLDVRDLAETWKLAVTAPGIDAIRGVLVLAAMLTSAGGIAALLLGFGRASLLSAVCAKAVWAASMVALLLGETPLAFDFQTTDARDLRDWTAFSPNLPTVVSIVLFVLLFFYLLTIVAKLARYGMLEAWYRRKGQT